MTDADGFDPTNPKYNLNLGKSPEYEMKWSTSTNRNYDHCDGFADGYSRGWQECWEHLTERAVENAKGEKSE